MGATHHPIVFEPLQLPNLTPPPSYSSPHCTSEISSFPCAQPHPLNSVASSFYVNKHTDDVQASNGGWCPSPQGSYLSTAQMPRHVRDIVAGTPPPSYSDIVTPPVPHTKLVFRSESSCIYPRLPRGFRLRVSAPNNRQPIDEIPSEALLVTRGALGAWQDLTSQQCEPSAPHRSLSHCAHYFFNHICRRGEQCGFVHALVVNPSLSVEFAPCEERVVISAPRPVKVGCGGTPPRLLRSPALSGDDPSCYAHLPSDEVLEEPSASLHNSIAQTSSLQPEETATMPSTKELSPIVSCPSEKRTCTRVSPTVSLNAPTGTKKFHFDPYRGTSGPTMRFLS
eukprot:CAMPEP_0176415608 /NCGR_PEP_ID=MMETSP0127-20121128/5899_1 /TAXON_ID=938130 /ORGANISM="Platyophrya macrostoma, Strain WH" /LENGTH=337 /DNA_ID=CAMNT_0017795619 /DNA_START=148 /DNA_END=1161 /DNA_ORIENTATION=+